MPVYTIIQYIVAVGVLIGGLDLLLGNRLGIGGRFLYGFDVFGKTVFTMIGIMSLAPTIAAILGPIIVPIVSLFGIDPSIFSIIISCDMGGYQLAESLAESPRFSSLFGLTVASMSGAAIVFIIPLASAVLQGDVLQRDFYRGVLYGISTIPLAAVCSAVLLGFDAKTLVVSIAPILILSATIIVCLIYIPKRTITAAQYFGRFIVKVGVVGIIIGFVSTLADIEIPFPYYPIADSMRIACDILIFLVGALSLLEVLNRVLKKPITLVGERFGLSVVDTSGIAATMASCVPTVAMMKDMSHRGVVVNGAWTVTSSSIFGSQMSFVLGIAPSFIAPFLISKFIAGFAGLLIAFYFTRNDSTVNAPSTA